MQTGRITKTCPWCYIGQRELQKAIEDVREDCSDLKIKIEHRPFLLHPSMEEDHVSDKLTWYKEKFGDEKLRHIQEMVLTRAKDVGVEV